MRTPPLIIAPKRMCWILFHSIARKLASKTVVYKQSAMQFGQRYRNSNSRLMSLRIDDAVERLQKRPIFLTNGRDDRRDGVCMSTEGVLHNVRDQPLRKD
jgi:hypothetical protein